MVSSLLILNLVLILLSGCPGDSETVPGAGENATPLPVVQAPDEVIADGEVEPIHSVELRLELSGIIDEVLVEEGQTVEEGTQLIRVDSRDLEMSVEEAQANLSQARADYDLLIEGATTEEIAAIEAQIRTAEEYVRISEAQVGSAEAEVMRSQGELTRVQGKVTSSDIAAAQAEVEAARAELARLEAGPKTTEVQESQAALDQARQDLQETRDRLSAAKTQAHTEMLVAANLLRDQQANYSDIYWENREIEEEYGTTSQNLDQRYKDREEQALRYIQNAEYELEQARIAYDNARQGEITGVAAAEARVRELEARHQELLNGTDADEVATARARLRSAEASLARLQGAERQGELTSAQAGVEGSRATLQQRMTDVERAQSDVEQYRAELAKLMADPRQSELDRALATLKQREVALKQARLTLEKATLTAPFDGTVVEVNPKEGEWFGTGEVALILADFSDWKIETTDLEEGEIVKVREGSVVRITFDAIPDLELPGKVVSIQGIGKNYQGDIVYEVTISPDQWDSRLRWKMTATVAIEPIEL
ncbi:MAG: HlyD family efflux transporter periplasmic adaptor subunit [Chloroflexaceae bacterium]|nr:HlyD family efflux transporter periplasmic adaptor subunit [Chloroflexaceae bacterium]